MLVLNNNNNENLMCEKSLQNSLGEGVLTCQAMPNVNVTGNLDRY